MIFKVSKVKNLQSIEFMLIKIIIDLAFLIKVKIYETEKTNCLRMKEILISEMQNLFIITF